MNPKRFADEPGIRNEGEHETLRFLSRRTGWNRCQRWTSWPKMLTWVTERGSRAALWKSYTRETSEEVYS